MGVFERPLGRLEEWQRRSWTLRHAGSASRGWARSRFAEFQGDPARKCAQAAHACADSYVVSATCKRTCKTEYDEDFVPGPAAFVGKEHDGKEYSHDESAALRRGDGTSRRQQLRSTGRAPRAAVGKGSASSVGTERRLRLGCAG